MRRLPIYISSSATATATATAAISSSATATATAAISISATITNLTLFLNKIKFFLKKIEKKIKCLKMLEFWGFFYDAWRASITGG
jgi:hypothetical protein